MGIIAQTHDIDQPVLEVRVVRNFEGLDQVRFEPTRLPLPLDGGP